MNNIGTLKAMGLVLLLMGVSLSGTFMGRYTYGGILSRAEYNLESVELANTLESAKIFYKDMMTHAVKSAFENELSVDFDNYCPHQTNPDDAKDAILEEGEAFIEEYEDYGGIDLPRMIEGEEEAEIKLTIAKRSFEQASGTVDKYVLVVEGKPLEPINITGGGRVLTSPATFKFEIVQTSDSKPDLVVESVSSTIKITNTSSRVTAKVTTINMGCGNSSADVVFAAYNETGAFLNSTKYAAEIAPGKKATISIGLPSGAEDSPIKFKADSTNKVSELNESNNLLLVELA